MTTPETADLLPRASLVALQHVVFDSPQALFGRLVREVHRGQLVMDAEGRLGPAWEPHLHAEWGCVVVETPDALSGELPALVPLHVVRLMTLAAGVSGAEAPRRGRPRTKRLAFSAGEGETLL